MELLARLKAHRMSMLFISHDLGVVGGIADRVVVMRQGTIREQGRWPTSSQRPQDAYTKRAAGLPPASTTEPGAADGDRRPHRRGAARQSGKADGPRCAGGAAGRDLTKSFWIRKRGVRRREFQAVKGVNFSCAATRWAWSASRARQTTMA